MINEFARGGMLRPVGKKRVTASIGPFDYEAVITDENENQVELIVTADFDPATEGSWDEPAYAPHVYIMKMVRKDTGERFEPTKFQREQIEEQGLKWMSDEEEALQDEEAERRIDQRREEEEEER